MAAGRAALGGLSWVGLGGLVRVLDKQTLLRAIYCLLFVCLSVRIDSEFACSIFSLCTAFFGVVIFRSLQLRMTLYALSLRRSSRAPHIASARQDLASVNYAQVTSPGRARKTKAAIVVGSSPQSRVPRPLVGVRARGHLRRRGLFPLHCTLWMRAFPLPCKPSLSIPGVQAA